jgi:hypothetical protein
VAHVGAYSWSWSHSESRNSSSTCDATAANEVSVSISGSACSNCSALSNTSRGASAGANSYGGSISVLHVGAYSWSVAFLGSSNSSSICRMTTASGVSVHVSGLTCLNCSALSTTSGGNAFGANSYGGAFSAAVFGAYSYSFSLQGSSGFHSRANVEVTQVNHLTITIKTAMILNAMALTGEYHFVRSIFCMPTRCCASEFQSVGTFRNSYGSNVSCN